MLLEKPENLLEVSVSPLVIQSSLASSIFIIQTVQCVKNLILNVLSFVAKLGIFRIQQE